MNQYVVLIRLPTKDYLGEDADAEQSRRLHAILDLVFSLGPAWSANAGGVLLHSELTHAQLVDRISPHVESSDFVGIVEMAARAVTVVGYDWEIEDLDRLYPNVVRLEGTYPAS